MGSSPSSSSSRRWTKTITCISSRLFFVLIIFQIPLFRVQCRSGICTNPVQIASSQVIASEILPVAFAKILLYPGAIMNALIKCTSIPNYDDLLEFYSLNHVNEAPYVIDLRHLEILMGSYLCVAGAIIGLLKKGRLSLYGMLLLLWGLVKERRQTTTCLDTCQAVQVSPIMLVALFMALSSIKSDVRVIIRSFQAHHTATAAVELNESVKKKKKDREMKRLEWTVNDVNNGKTTPRSTKVAQAGIINPF